jgi:AcrR family transcriptional regulator
MGDVSTAKPQKAGESGSTRTAASDGKAPRTARGERTLRRILDAALKEFGDKGFADSSIVGITSRAKVALGTFYTYFDSKEAVFSALVRDMSDQVRLAVAPALDGASDAFDVERRALAEFLRFVRRNQQVYRIIDEAEFVDPAGFRRHYQSTAERIAARLSAGEAQGDLRAPATPLEREVQAWALMGANVFLGLRFGVWGREDEEQVAAALGKLLRGGLQRD